MNKYEEVAYAHLPDGVEVKLHKPYTGRARYSRMELVSPPPRGAKSCEIFMHEIAHFELHHPANRVGPKQSRYIEEYEAERWAIEKMRDAGLAVPLKIVYSCKKHVTWAIYKALKRGLRHVDRDVARWSGIDMENVLAWEENNR
jgi:hypothetical protein